MAVRGWLTLVCAILAANGCGDDSAEEDAGEKPRVCTPGTVYSCFRAGCKGHQTCASDGSSLSRCTCDPAEQDAGDAPDACAGDCREPAPADWSGPIALRSAKSVTPSCEGSFDELVFEAGAQPSAAAASCSSCSCNPAGSACAAFVDFGTGSEAGCGGTSCTTSVNQSCAEIMPPCLSGLASAYLSTKLASGSGTCSASSQTPELPEVKWTERAAICRAPAAQGDGCDGGRTCVAQPGDGAELCLYREGEHDCPSQQYDERHVYYRDVDDTRSCSACACSGPSCKYTWSVFNAGDTSCASPIIKLTNPGQCVQVNPSADKLRVGATIEGDGACKPSGGESTGGVRGSRPVTVCCAD